jgi:nitroimidazol reductase NimA-like FMN-containing flavoprotein (pyridoxamine 5'-phosphate oxidase superfamily)
MEEEDVARELSEAMESCMDVDEVTWRPGSRTVKVELSTGELFRVRVTKIEEAEEEDE